jgi:hypothetical protein
LIDITRWDKAIWKGVFYMCGASQPPIMALLFLNKEVAIKIFAQWYVRIGRSDDYEEMRISIIEGDVPGEDPGYTVYIANANVPPPAALGVLLPPSKDSTWPAPLS